jgi:diguanylate cyclase (GGDEF)-like protein
VDLDNFKNINDALGHAVGDLLLKELAQRFRAAVRPPNWVTRHGGDEFIIVMPRLYAEDDAVRLAESLMRAIAEPFHAGRHELRITSSVGISIYPEHGRSIDELVSNADLAMYEAKRSGRNACRFCAPEYLLRSAARLAMENGLRVAVAEKRLSLVYQPKVAIATGRIVSLEALLRWNSAHAGPISPSIFIPIAEESGLIVELSEWVLTEALAAARRLRLVADRDVAVAVNISPVQFRSERLLDALRRLVADEPAVSRLLEIEVTEYALAGDIAEVTTRLRALEALGVKIAVDDFGTGYSSLAYLKNFPIHVLKIDQTFIRDLHVNARDKAIVGSVVQLGKSLGCEVIAEGVERREHVESLTALGCDYAQGFWFAAPMPESDIAAALSRQAQGSA